MRLFLFLLFVMMCACGGKLGHDPNEIDPDAAPEGGRVPRLPDGGTFIDPKCPDSGPPPITIQCDVLRPTQTCQPGTACYPVTFPPEGKCETERYGTECLTPGKGKQGAPCGSGSSQGCAAGFICVITGGTTECAQACDLGAKGSCQSGFVCEPIDVPGFAVCL